MKIKNRKTSCRVSFQVQALIPLTNTYISLRLSDLKHTQVLHGSQGINHTICRRVGGANDFTTLDLLANQDPKCTYSLLIHIYSS